LNSIPPFFSIQALERIAGLLDAQHGGLVVLERGDAFAISKHTNFRIFGAMNPATDTGKRDLPASLRNHFTEIWIGEPEQREDLVGIVARYFEGSTAPVDAIADFYMAAKAEAVRIAF
jgi:midasin